MNLTILLISLFNSLFGYTEQLKQNNFLNKLSDSNNKEQATTNNRDSIVTNYKKLAVLVGVDEYKYIRPLSTSVNSVNELAVNLKSHGYDTLVYLNISQSNFMVNGMRDISAKQKAENYDVILFYLSGHFDAINTDELFFLTADCNPMGDANNYLAGGSLQVFNLASRLVRMNPKIGMFLLDSPSGFELGSSTEKETLNAFLEIGSGRSNMLFGSGIGNYNREGKGSNGPISLYAEAIINSLNTPNLNLIQAFDNVNNYVKQKTGGKVTASYKSGISDNFCFSCK